MGLILGKIGKFFWGYIVERATGAFLEWALDYGIVALAKKTDNPYDDKLAEMWVKCKEENGCELNDRKGA